MKGKPLISARTAVKQKRKRLPQQESIREHGIPMPVITGETVLFAEHMKKARIPSDQTESVQYAALQEKAEI